jgi:hypothetical protein
MAHSVVGDPNASGRVLAVENVRTEGFSDGSRRIHYTVRNAGLSPIPGYLKTYMKLRP